MPLVTIQAKFAFGDRVRFDSQLQQCIGEGTVFAVTLDRHGQIDYIIEIDCGGYSDLQPGILENEIVLLEDVA